MPRGVHSGSRGNRRAKLEYNMQRTEDASREAITATGDLRRAAVYRTDVQFAAPEKAPPLPQGDARDLFAAQVAVLRGRGFSYLKIGELLGYEQHSIRTICLEYCIPKGEK